MQMTNEIKEYCPVDGTVTKMRKMYQLNFGSIVQCNDCGLIRYYPGRSPMELVAVHNKQSYFEHPYFEARRKINEQQVYRKYERLIKSIAMDDLINGKRLLDIGCDTGSLLVVARDVYKMKVEGVEVSRVAACIARKNHDLIVHEGLIEDLNLKSDYYDIVTMIDMIEHVSDPSMLLKQANRILKTKGKLYIVTVNHDALINIIGFWLYRIFRNHSLPLLEKLYIPYHEYYFTQKTLVSLLNNSNFYIVNIKTKEFPLDEFGHGTFLKVCLSLVFILQKIFRRQSLLEVIAEKR